MSLRPLGAGPAREALRATPIPISGSTAPIGQEQRPVGAVGVVREDGGSTQSPRATSAPRGRRGMPGAPGSLLKRLHQQFESYKEQVRKIGEEARRYQGEHKDDAPTCGICLKTKFADGCGHLCSYCRTKFCARCGGRVSLRSNNATEPHPPIPLIDPEPLAELLKSSNHGLKQGSATFGPRPTRVSPLAGQDSLFTCHIRRVGPSPPPLGEPRSAEPADAAEEGDPTQGLCQYELCCYRLSNMVIN
ncbi:Regulating synaptic membrane exocytosis protein 1 [Chelonia mydas]|uniref:Regulating synaptic membrane exocytosis protein 1 n=1 Tax=Chelonia mydas TaxID=8469 RepID=M7BQ39_CHEMY|nr:Regulating synaptic membrane exocytosis protein 1 [Chelonia mydas]